MARPRQQVEILSLGTQELHEVLKLTEPPFLVAGEALRQLGYIDDFVRGLGCHSLLIETHYIDRHYMEDYSVFYSRNLYPFENFCRRLHFFTCDQEELHSSLEELRRGARDLPEEDLRARCGEFSRQSYLGFSIIKPLPGSPVGRTVLRPYPEGSNGGVSRRFPCIRYYTVHLGGLALTVRGLAFQQQDVGVSACATTALWSSLQKFQDFEDIGSATPAQITMLASQYALPFGRAMPSEGLSTDQMCQAVRALGVSPNLFQAVDFHTARGYLYSAISSQAAPILILWDSVQDSYHAVVAVGMDVRTSQQSPTNGATAFAEDRASNLVGLYVHDDRIGPYVPAPVNLTKEGLLSLDLPDGPWFLTHILIPMHAKIRLSFSGLREISFRLLEAIQAFRESVLGQVGALSFDPRITPSHLYLKELLTSEPEVTPERVERLWSKVPLPRYVGIVRIEADFLDPIHFLVDCTSTERNVHSLAVLALRTKRDETPHVVKFLADRYDCPVID